MTNDTEPTETGRYDLFKDKAVIAGGLIFAGLASWIHAEPLSGQDAIWVFSAFITGAVLTHYLKFIYLILKLLIPYQRWIRSAREKLEGSTRD